MKNNTIKSNKWLIRILLLLAYLMPFSHLFIYYRDEPITLCVTALWIVFLCVTTLKTNNSSLIFPGHCLSFFVSFVCSSYRFHSALNHPMACLPLLFLEVLKVVRCSVEEEKVCTENLVKEEYRGAFAKKNKKDLNKSKQQKRRKLKS